MATAPLFDPEIDAGRWIADYRRRVTGGDLLADAADARWQTVLTATIRASGDDRARPSVPLLIDAAEWDAIAVGAAQRAELLETILAELAASDRLVSDGMVPAALVTGSPLFLRGLRRVSPPGGHHLRLVAFDLLRGPGGEWRVMADRLGAPTGLARALAARAATLRLPGDGHARLGIAPHDAFTAAFRDGLATACRRAEPRLALLTAGRGSAGHAEDAELARRLDLLPVEGGDLSALGDTVFLRTIAGLKRVDALWQRMDARALDPLALAAGSRIGVPGLIDAYAAGGVALANAPGAAMLEAPAWLAFLPRLAERLLGTAPILPNVATWWCGQPAACAHVEANLDTLAVAPAFERTPPLDPASLLADVRRRPQDRVGHERVVGTTTPVLVDGRLEPRAFRLRVFATRDAAGAWRVLPGGHATIDGEAEGGSADVWVATAISAGVPVVRLEARAAAVRRNPGTLPSRAADDLFWLGRYLERGAALVALVGALVEATGTPDGAATRLTEMVAAQGLGPAPSPSRRSDLLQLARTALDAPDAPSVATLAGDARRLGEALGERLPAGVSRLLAAWPTLPERTLADRVEAAAQRHLAICGVVADMVARTAAWRFLDLGRRIERSMGGVRAAAHLGHDAAGGDLHALLTVTNNRANYQERYTDGIGRGRVLDLVLLDPGNPRSVAFGVAAINRHLQALPVLVDDGMAEDQQARGAALAARIGVADASALDPPALWAVDAALAGLSDAVARRYFLQGAEPLRAGGLTLA